MFVYCWTNIRYTTYGLGASEHQTALGISNIQPSPIHRLLLFLTMTFFEQVENVLDRVAAKDILLLGDFNAKHQECLPTDPTNVHDSTPKDLMDRFDMS